MINLIFIIHLFSCFFMTGLIWVIQILHYPSYKYIDLAKFIDYQKFHTTAITFIVGPIMLFEVTSGLYLLIKNDFSKLDSINFSGLFLIWLATAFLSVPAHGKLSLGYNESAIQFLIHSNWLRTILWTLRSGLLIYILNLKLN